MSAKRGKEAIENCLFCYSEEGSLGLEKLFMNATFTFWWRGMCARNLSLRKWV